MSADNNITLSAVLKNAEKEGFLSNRAASVLLSQGDRQIQMPQMKPAFEDPIYVAIIIDNSGSMDPYKAAVIRGQNQLLSVLRGSKKCKKKALLVGHYLFSGTVQPLNSFELLDPSGNDRVLYWTTLATLLPTRPLSIKRSFMYYKKWSAAFTPRKTKGLRLSSSSRCLRMAKTRMAGWTQPTFETLSANCGTKSF